METIIYVIGGLVVYFIPTIIGWNSKSASGIIVLNLFLGWTILGWVGALIWAVSAPKENSNKANEPTQEFSDIVQKKVANFLNKLFGKTINPLHSNDEVKILRSKLKYSEAIIKNKLTENYEIVSAENWEKILLANRQDDYEIIEEK